MNRRDAIFNFVVLTAGVSLLPACGQQDAVTIPLKNISLTASEEKLVLQLTNLIIPKTDFIGAADLKAGEFALTMVDDCYTPEKQQLFKEGLQQFDKLAKDQYGKSFAACTTEEQNEFLKTVAEKNKLPESAKQFYAATRSYTIQAFTSSKDYMLGIAKYKMVPGSNFKGCVPVKQA